MLQIRTLLYALDVSDAAAPALAVAADLAERAGAALHLLHVDPARGGHQTREPGAPPDAALRRRVMNYVREVLGGETALDALDATLHVSHGATPGADILRHAGAIGADLIITGTHGRTGLQRVILGSVAVEVLRSASIPVLVVPEEPGRRTPDPARPVLAAIDVHEPSGHLASAAREVADVYQAPLALLHARAAPPDTLLGPRGLPASARQAVLPVSRGEARAALGALVPDRVPAPELYVLPGAPETEVVGLADRLDAGMIVIGTHGRTGLKRLREGSVAEAVIRRAPCPVLVVPRGAGE